MADSPPPVPMQEDAPPLPLEENGVQKGDQDQEDRRGNRERSKSRRRSRSRERKRRSSRSRERRRSRSRDRGRRDRDERERRSRRSRSRERRRRSRSRERAPPVVGGYGGVRRRRSPTPPEVRAERERQVELESLDRDTRTVFAYNLPLKAEEKDVFQFFIRAGPLNDIKIITDKVTGRSKGFAYIEFQRKEDVIGALSLTGQVLMGQPVMVKMSEAEKNLAWEAAEQAKRLQREMGVVAPAAAAAPSAPAGAAAAQTPQVPQGPARLVLSNLPTSITEPDLRPIFEPFGALDFVTLQRDVSGYQTGIGFVQYQLLADATKAKENLHGLDIVGHSMVVTWTSLDTPLEALAIAPPMPAMPALGPGGVALPGMAAAAGMPVELPENLGEGVEGASGGVGGGLKLTGGARAALMSKLAANAGLDMSNVPQIPLPQVPQQPQFPAALQLEQGLLGPASPIPTQCLLLKNMFNPAEETEQDWDREIAEDVGGECAKYGPVEHVYVDPASQGFVYVKFGSVPAATNAQRALHGRWFAQRQIVADFQFTPVYNQHFQL